jgi:hypothetical protein
MGTHRDILRRSRPKPFQTVPNGTCGKAQNGDQTVKIAGLANGNTSRVKTGKRGNAWKPQGLRVETAAVGAVKTVRKVHRANLTRLRPPTSAWPLFVTITVKDSKLTLSWPTLPGGAFSVESAGDLGGPWGTAPGTPSSNGGTATWTTATTPSVAQFYRVVLTQ